MTSPRFTIYCITNKVNGKRYVGQTVESVDVRWQRHVSASKQNRGCPLLGKAIRKYGRDVFKIEPVESVSDQKTADEFEKKWICRLQSRSPHGYNLDAGGAGGGAHHEDSKLLISKRLKSYWQNATPERRADHTQNLRWSPERKARGREAILKSWAARREKYGEHGHAKNADSYIEGQRKSWNTRRARYGEQGRAPSASKYSHGIEHGKKTKEGLRAAREAKSARLVRINLLSPSP